jgi:hypothetical protein
MKLSYVGWMLAVPLTVALGCSSGGSNTTPDAGSDTGAMTTTKVTGQITVKEAGETFVWKAGDKLVGCGAKGAEFQLTGMKDPSMKANFAVTEYGEVTFSSPLEPGTFNAMGGKASGVITAQSCSGKVIVTNLPVTNGAGKTFTLDGELDTYFLF